MATTIAKITREKITDILEKIALLLELKGENSFKIRAYRSGAEIVSTHPEDIVALAADEDTSALEAIKGIGAALVQKLHELATTGALEFYDNLRSEFPPTIFELLEVQGLGPKKVRSLYTELEVSSLADLKAVCQSGKVASLSGFGEKTVVKLLENIAFHESHAGLFRLGDVAGPAEEILASLKAHPAVSRAEITGSYRRSKEIVHDLDFLVASSDPAAVMEHFVTLPSVASILTNGKTKSSTRLESGLQCDLRVVSGDEWPFTLAYFTGSKEHNVEVRKRFLKKGLSLNEYGLTRVEGGAKSGESAEVPTIHEESDLYKALGLDHIPPELREHTTEFAAAESGGLPDLIKIENLSGTFHNHTVASDGKNTLEEMAEAAIELGLDYLGIADHSKSSVQANGLDEKRLRSQIEEIAALNKGFDGFELFAGTECDILKNGDLDFDDDLLAELDYTVASVHSSFTLKEAEMTRRIIKAIENPHVTMLGHLTGRLLLSREPYAVNVPAIIDAAAETGTIIELNANPWRLDMDWRWWRHAAEKGVRCAINPDAHKVDHLQYLFFGVRLARKGWLTKADVINCLPLSKVEEQLQQKRKGTS